MSGTVRRLHPIGFTAEAAEDAEERAQLLPLARGATEAMRRAAS